MQALGVAELATRTLTSFTAVKSIGSQQKDFSGLQLRTNSVPKCTIRSALRNGSVAPRWKDRRNFSTFAQSVSEDVTETESEDALPEEPEEQPSSVGIYPFLDKLKTAIAEGDEKMIATIELEISERDNDLVKLDEFSRKLQDELSLAKDRFLRLNADFDNFRKRSEREKIAMASTVRGEVIESLLPMVDSFEQAKTAIRTDSEGEARVAGAYQGIYKQFVDVMKGLGVTAVDSLGEPFDPNVHDAIMQEESAEFPEGIIIQEFRKGFQIGEKLLRPAMVKVSSGPGPSSPTEESSSQSPSSDEENRKEEEGPSSGQQASGPESSGSDAA